MTRPLPPALLLAVAHGVGAREAIRKGCDNAAPSELPPAVESKLRGIAGRLNKCVLDLIAVGGPADLLPDELDRLAVQRLSAVAVDQAFALGDELVDGLPGGSPRVWLRRQLHRLLRRLQ